MNKQKHNGDLDLVLSWMAEAVDEIRARGGTALEPGEVVQPDGRTVQIESFDLNGKVITFAVSPHCLAIQADGPAVHRQEISSVGVFTDDSIRQVIRDRIRGL